MKKIFTLFAVVCACTLVTFAEDFEKDGIYYNILNGGDSVEVTYRGSSDNEYDNEYSGSVTIPSTVSYNSISYRVTTIGERAFDNCDSLTAITIPNGVTTIGKNAFSICSRLAEVNIPNSVTTIGYSAFSGCRSLTSITLPSSVTTIGAAVFRLCSYLTKITCEAVKPPKIDDVNTAFYRVDPTIPLYVPDESVISYKLADEWNYFTNILPISFAPSVPTDLERLYDNVSTETRKVLENGTIRILKSDGSRYTIDGRRVN